MAFNELGTRKVLLCYEYAKGTMVCVRCSNYGYVWTSAFTPCDRSCYYILAKHFHQTRSIGLNKLSTWCLALILTK